MITLIELLAVIVILAILALIVSPIISGVIADAKKAAAERSMEGYVKAVELAQVKFQAKTGGKLVKKFEDLSVEFSNTNSIKSPSIIFDSDGMISVGNVIINGYFCSYIKGENVQCGKALKPNDSCFSCMDEYNGVIITDYDCDYSSIIIPDEIKGEKVVGIGHFAFSRKKLTYVEISNNVKIIDRDAFSLNYLTSVKIPSSVTEIGFSSFLGNALTSVTIPSNVKKIDPIAFYNNKLTSVTLEEGLEYIGAAAFDRNDLTSVTIPSSVKDIGITAFHHDDDTNLKLTTITNKTGIAFNWGDIINGESGYEFATGTVENDYGDVTIN